MEFSYRVSEKDYLQAWKLRRKGMGRVRTFKTVMFWAFILVCLILLGTIITKNNAKVVPEPAPMAASSEPLWVNLAPFGLLAVIWGFLIFQLAPGGCDSST